MKKFLLISCASAALLLFAPKADAGPPLAAALSTATTASANLITLGITGLGAFGALAVDFAVRATLGYALNALSSKPTDISRGYSRSVNQLGPALPHQVIYGETVVGGAVFYQALTDTNTKLHRCIAFAGHEIESYEAIYLNDQQVTLDGSGNVTAPADFAGNVRIKQYLGSDSQTADSDLVSEVSEWTTDHRASGVAYLYVRFDGASNFPNGVPNVSAKIKGKKVPNYQWAAHNLLTYSQELDNAAWTAVKGTVTANATTDPDGGSTAELFTEDSTGGEHLIFYDDILATSAADYVIAIWAKTNGRDLQIRPRGRGTGQAWANYDLSAGTVGNSGGSALVSATMSDEGSGWYLCKLKFTSQSDPDVGVEFQLIEDAAVDGEEHFYPGGGASGVYLWGAHFYRDDRRGMVNSSRGDTYVVTTSTTTANADIEEYIAWSSNPAICMRDYLTSDYGLSESFDNIDDELFLTAADYCDADLSPARFSCNGSFNLEASPEEIIRNMLSSMGGTFWNYSGNWAVLAAQYQEPALELGKSDLRGNLQVATRHSRRDNFNTVRGQYKGAETEYQPDDYTEVTVSSFITEDGGIKTAAELNLLFTDTEVMAQRIAEIFLRRNRYQQTIAASFGLRALDLKVGDNIFLTLPEVGYQRKIFEVVDWRLGIDENDIVVNMILREMNQRVYTGETVNLVDESFNILTDESDNNLQAIL